MCASILIPEPETSVEGTLDPILAATHDRWMAEADKALGPVMDSDATFSQRWVAARYLSEEFAERLQLEQQLIDELPPFLCPEAQERLSAQAARVRQLRQDLSGVVHRLGTVPEMIRVARALMDALRLWYAEIEFAIGRVHLADVSPTAARLLQQWERGTLAESCPVW
jgi:hypothetical protein